MFLPSSTAVLVTVLAGYCSLAAALPGYLGCFAENVRHRYFSTSPGSFAPDRMTSAYCRERCGTQAYSFSAVADGKFCFCSQELPTASFVSDGLCSSLCAGDNLEFCGSVSHVGVYATAQPVTGLQVTSDVTVISATPATITLSVSIDKGTNVSYRADYADGAGFTASNETGFNTRVLYLPGDYSISVAAENELQAIYTSIGVRLDDPVKDVEVVCPSIFATHEEGNCSVTVWRGSHLQLDARVTDKIDMDIHIDNIADAKMSMVGPWSSDTEPYNLGVDTVFVSRSLPFPTGGKVYGWRMHVSRTGPLQIMILSASCGSSLYCPETNDCRSSCEAGLTATTSVKCCSNLVLCLQEAKCSRTCTQSNGSCTVNSYIVKHSLSVSLDATGSLWQEQNPPLEVAAGDVIGLYVTTSGGLLSSVRNSSQHDVVTPSNEAPSVGKTYSSVMCSSSGRSHALQAFLSAGSKILLRYTFVGDPGVFPLNVTVVNKNLQLPPVNASADIILLEGIDHAIIEGPCYVSVGEICNFTLARHTGDNLTYDWDVSDGSMQSHEAFLEHTFTNPGEYNITVAAYNAISRKDNVTTVNVQDKLAGLAIQASDSETNIPVNFSIAIAKGTNYTCELDFGDGSNVSVTDYTQTAIPTSQQTHIYSRYGLYTVMVTCQNNVSNETASTDLLIEEAIMNLRLEKDGTRANSPFSIAWLVDAGRNINFSLSLDGTDVLIDWTASSSDNYRWQSVQVPGLPPASYQLILLASNRLSSANVTVGFIVLEEIANPTLTCDLSSATTDDTFIFAVNMDAGSDVTVVVEYQDGSLNYTYHSAGAAWNGPLLIPHNFISSCVCEVKATVSNAAGSYELIKSVVVRTGFSTISWSLPDAAYYLYHPPALVYFEFSSNSTDSPTSPTLTIDWGDGTPMVVTDYITFGSPGFSNNYDDTMDYTLTVTMSNAMSSRTLVHHVIVVEKLVGPSIVLDFPEAPLNQPYNVTFTLNRGDQGNMTTLIWDLGDGQPVRVTNRKGIGYDGKDTLAVTYSTAGWKTVTVTAIAPLNQTVGVSKSFEVVTPVIASALSITADDKPLGSPTVFQVQYSSGGAPLKAEIQIDYYGDGSVVSSPTAFTGSESISYSYSKDGLHHARVIIYNNASRVDMQVVVGVYQPFINLKAYLTCRSDILVEQNGLQNDGVTFPLDTPIKFVISDDNNASATAYELASVTGPTQVSQEFSTNAFYFLFPADGIYTLNITATNPLSHSTKQQTVKIVQRVHGLNVAVVSNQVAPGELTSLKFSFTDFGDDTCVYIDWDDLGAKSKFGNNINTCSSTSFITADAEGNMDELTTKLVGHRYLTEGVYSIKVLAQNAYGTEVLERTLTVSYTRCSRPNVFIQDSQPAIHKATKYTRSSIIRIRGMADINCSGDLNNTKLWTLAMVENGTGAIVAPVNVSELVTDKAELYIPARHLPVGHYLATYTMVMEQGKALSLFLGLANTFFEVTESRLVGIMTADSVSEITRGSAQRLILEPVKYSTDPDVEPSASQDLSVDSWQCQVTEPRNASQASCASVSPTAQSQDIDGASLMQGYTYNISANLSKGSRLTSTNIIVTINGTNPLSGKIRCIKGSVCYARPNGYTVPESSRLSLQCQCLACTPAAQYDWFFFFHDYRWPNGLKPLKMSEINKWSISVISSELSLEKGFFLQYKGVADVFKVQCDINDSTSSGSIATQMLVNRGPVDGSCTIEPKNATSYPAAKKLWLIKCQGWKDDDGIQQYQIYSIFHVEEGINEITSLPTSEGNIQINVSLPTGPIYRGYKQDIYVVVKDLLNAATTFMIDTVEAWPPNKEELRQFVDSELKDKSNYFSTTFMEGDQRSVSELASAFASTLTQDSSQMSNDTIYVVSETLMFSVGSECGLGDMFSVGKFEGYEVPENWICTGYGPNDSFRPNAYKPFPDVRDEYKQYTFDADRNRRAQFRANMVKSILILSYEDVVSIQQVACLLVQVTSAVTEITAQCQELILEAVDIMITNLLDPVKMANVPQEDIERAMDHIFSVIGNIIESAGHTGFFPTQTDMELTRKNSLWRIYDTSIKSLGDKTDVSKTRSYDEANNKHTHNVFKILYKEQAHDIAQKVNAMLKQLVQLFNGISIPGHVKELTSSRMRLLMEKNLIRTFLGRSIQIKNSSAEIEFPSTLEDLFHSRVVSPNEVVIFQAAQSTNNPERYTKMALESFHGYSHFVTAEFFDENGSVLPVNQTITPIRIDIPHDDNAPPCERTLVNPMVANWNQFQLHRTEISAPNSSILFQFEIEQGAQLVVVVNFNQPPDSAENATEFIFVVPPSVESTRISPDTIVLSSEDVNGRTGTWWIGVQERSPEFVNTSVPTNTQLTDRYKKGSGPFARYYNVTIWVSGCYFLGSEAEEWDTRGCVVSSASTQEKTVCMCNHLTTFGGGFLVAPNVIDWNFVFNNADFLSNPTIYITQIFITICFIIAFVLARRKDRKDLQMIGLSPLQDNDPRDKYYYEILVSTGMRRNAGTDSKVFVIMSGEENETDVRMFTDSKRSIFKRGMTNGFLMAVPECLGHINYLHIWHDNSGKGKFRSWYLNYIVVKDIQKGTKQIFIADRWFAVEKDDGQVGRIIPVSGKTQIEDFSYQFSERSTKSMAEDHLWFSVIARPPGSRFTCVERVACCLCLLFMTMLTNAMFYQTQGNSSTTSSTSFTFGPFALSVSQIFIGIVSTLIVFPVNFLLVFLFRKAQRRPHNSVIPPGHYESLNTGRLAETNAQVGNEARPAHGSPLYASKDYTSLFSSSLAGLSKSGTPEAVKTSIPVPGKKSCPLPWWCVWLAWILLVLCTLMSAILVTFYGISFQDYTCKQWITSLIISFFTSVFITQPLKVILTAIFLSLIVKNPTGFHGGEEDNNGRAEYPETELLHGVNGSSTFAMSPRPIELKPPDDKELEQIRAQRLKEVQMWSVIREIILYSLFIWILLIISYRNRGPDNFNYKNSMARTFLLSPDTDINYDTIENKEDFWTWARSGFVHAIMAGSYYNSYPPLRLRSYINDKASRILGHATLRQLRIKPGKCDVPFFFRALIHECNVLYSLLLQEEDNFDVGWRKVNSYSNTAATRSEYKWSSASSLNSYPYWGTLAVYSGGGYVAHLNGTNDEVKEMITQLENENWIDAYTRAVFVEFSVYNPQVNLFSVNTLLLEFHTTNGIITSYRFEPAMLLPYFTDVRIFYIVCEIIFVIFIISFIIVEVLQVIKLRCQYLLHFWSWVEVAIIACSITAIVIYFYRLVETNKLTKQFKASQGNEYVKFQYVGYLNEIFGYIVGFVTFLATIKFLRLLRFNKRISLLSSTLRHCAVQLLNFSVIFWIVFLAFCQLFYLTFMNVDENYSSFTGSVISSILMMMGKFDMYYMIMAEPGLTQIIVLLYVLCVAFIIVNMFVSILTDSFTAVRSDIQKQSNDYEVLDFMLDRFKTWTGIGHSSNTTDPCLKRDFTTGDDGENRLEDNMAANTDGFSSKFDRLLHSLSAIYSENNRGSDRYKLMSNSCQAIYRALARVIPISSSGEKRSTGSCDPKPSSSGDSRNKETEHWLV